MTPTALPTREQVRQKLHDVLVGRISREDASSWADTWVVDSDPDVDDFVVWKALTQLSGVDLRVNATDYLHNEADIHDWLDKVENSIDRHRPE